MTQYERLLRYTLVRVRKIPTVKFKEIEETYGGIAAFCRKMKIKPPQGIEEEIKGSLILGDEDYPDLLSRIADPPVALYKTGRLKTIPDKCIAIVGTRNYSSYGKRAAEEITREYCLKGYCIVSGLAEGIDTIVHKTCLEENGTTVAVLGGDLNKPYPASNTELYKKIKQKGCVISEYNKNVGYEKYMFIRRNRIIAGLCRKIVIVEAPLKSGALITARFGLEYNREVISVPGDIYRESSQGCNFLIKNNFASIYYKDRLKDPPKLADEADNSILKLIEKENCALDDLCGMVYMSRPELIKRLTKLEIEGIIAKDMFDRYIVLS